MSIQVPKDAEEHIREASEALGVGKEEIVDRAIQVYLDSIQKFVDLKKEFKAWDQLSDEALQKFEESL